MKLTKRQKAIVKELESKEYFYTRYTSTKDMVLRDLKNKYPTLRLREIDNVIDKYLQMKGRI